MRGTGLVPAGANPTARQNCACSPDQFVYCSTMATYCFHRQSRTLANILSGADSPHGRGHVHLLPRPARHRHRDGAPDRLVPGHRAAHRGGSAVHAGDPRPRGPGL